MCTNETEVDKYVSNEIKKAMQSLPKKNGIHETYRLLIDLHLKLTSRYCYLNCKNKLICPSSEKTEKINRLNKEKKEWEETL